MISRTLERTDDGDVHYSFLNTIILVLRVFDKKIMHIGQIILRHHAPSKIDWKDKKDTVLSAAFSITSINL